MTGLERHGSSPGGAVGSPATPVPPRGGRGTSVDEVEWTGTVLEWEDLGAVVPRPGRELTSAVVDDGVVRRTGDGGFARHRLGWSALNDRVVVARCEQRLQPRPDGRLSPAGGYSFVAAESHVSVATPTRRRGEVAIDPSAGPTGEVGAHAQGDESPDDVDVVETRRFPVAVSSVALLPAAVRRSIYARASRPTVFSALASRLSTGATTVSALRMDAAVGIVVVAGLQPGSRTWQVEQRVYEFGGRHTLPGSSSGGIGS